MDLCPSSFNLGYAISIQGLSSHRGVMGSFKFDFSKLGLQQKPQVSTFFHTPHTLRITCGLRNGPRKPMWRSRVLSTEAIQAVQSLKLAQNSSSKLEQVLSSKLSRLLKADLLDTLGELQRQNELDLALKVFNFVRKEVWYVPDPSLFNDMILMLGKNKMVEMVGRFFLDLRNEGLKPDVFNFVRKEVWYVPDLSSFNDMIMMLGKNKMIEMVEQIFLELRNEGLEPDARTYTELIGAYFKVEMVKKAMETYELMKASGLVPEKLTLTILIRNLEKAGEEHLAETIKKECAEYFDYPEKFLEEVERTFPKRKKLIFI